MSVPITHHLKIEIKVTELDHEFIKHSIVTNVPADLLEEFLDELNNHFERLTEDITNEE